MSEEAEPQSKAPSPLRSAGALQIEAIPILHFDSIDSTNLEAMRQAKSGAAEGLCIIAREQTHGRGRLDRSWHSPKDAGLYFSIVLRPQFEMARWPLLSLAAAVAVADALMRTCELTVDIKWPNDICANEKKLAGILAETVETPHGTAIVLGIGINLTNENFAPELNGLATSISSVTEKNVDRKLLVKELLKAIGDRYELLQSAEGGEKMIRDWSSRSSYAHERDVRVTLHDQVLEGTTRGLEPDGALRVEIGDGTIKTVRAGDVTALRATTIGNPENER